MDSGFDGVSFLFNFAIYGLIAWVIGWACRAVYREVRKRWFPPQPVDPDLIPACRPITLRKDRRR